MKQQSGARAVWWRLRRTMKSPRTIRTRVLAMALVPGLALVITGSTFVGLALDESLSARKWSQGLGVQIDPLIGFVDAVQAERAYSLRALGGDMQASADLAARRRASDAAINEIAEMLPRLMELNPSAFAKSGPVFRSLLSEMPTIRHSIDIEQYSAAEIDEFYTGLAGVMSIGLHSSARSSPESETASDEIVTAELFTIAELHARSIGRVWGPIANGGLLSTFDRQVYARLIGAFHDRLDVMVDQLESEGRTRYDKLVASDEWRSMVAAEDALTLTGRLPFDMDEWSRAQEAVSGQLRALWGDYFRYSERAATKAADASVDRSAGLGIVVLVTAAVTFIVAAVLARSLIRRLRSLRDKTLESAEQTLPSIVQRLNDGQPVDVDAELVLVDNGTDEIGQVAAALNTAQRTAISAAAAEARTRGGINRVFLDIARRSQIVVHQQLQVLDTAEAKQNDPDHLELLFQLDHLATRARRNAENLLLLGGGQPGRRWRNPVALEEIVRGAISETRDFTRVSAVRLPEVDVAGAVVADLIHLLAELIDNATTFSPPDSLVSVRANLVGKGVVVEVEDQGLGIRFEERERLNAILSEPSDFQEMALAGHRHLGLFVIGQLAQRHGIAVNLLESAYGGVKAIALVPENLLVHARGSGVDVTEATHSEPVARPHRPAFVPQTVNDPVPRMPGPARPPVPSVPVEAHTMDVAPQVTSPRSAQGSARRPIRELPPAVAGGRAKAPLPRRERLTHLAPQLRITADEAGSGDSSIDEPRRRNPEKARSSMTAFQRGTRDGRDSGRIGG